MARTRFEVVYYSLTGNTKKVAEAIATELDVVAQDVKARGRLADDSFVFLGAGLYGPLRGLSQRDRILQSTLGYSWLGGTVGRVANRP